MNFHSYIAPKGFQLLLAILFVTIGCSSDKEYNYGIEYIHGNVKSVDLSVFEAKFWETIEEERHGIISCPFNTKIPTIRLNR